MYLTWGVIAMLVSLGIGYSFRRTGGTAEVRTSAQLGFLVLGNCVLLAWTSVRTPDNAWLFVSGESIAYAVAVPVVSLVDMVRRSKQASKAP